MSRIGLGSALLIRDRRTGTHLWVVLTDPEPLSGRMVVAPIVTERAHTDKTVRLLVGDHPFIRHASNVSYGDAEFAFLGKLTDAVARGEASMAQPVSGALLRRMQDGLLMSSRTIHVIVDYVRSFLAEYE